MVMVAMRPVIAVTTLKMGSPEYEWMVALEVDFECDGHRVGVASLFHVEQIGSNWAKAKNMFHVKHNGLAGTVDNDVPRGTLAQKRY